MRSRPGHRGGASTGTAGDIHQAVAGHENTGTGYAEKVNAHHQGMEALRVDRLARCEGHSTIRTAVVTTLHGDDVLLSGEDSSHLDGGLNGLRTLVPEEERVQGLVRHLREEFLDELQVRRCESYATL